MAKPRSNLFFPVLLLLAVLGGWFWRSNRAQTVPIKEIAESKPSPSPELTQTGIAPDGKISLTLNHKQAGENNAWSLTVKINNSQKQIWTEILPDDVIVSIPFNTVSPDNKYLFIQENVSGTNRYLVFLTNGKPINQSSQSIEFTDAFSAKYPDLKITATTGWAAPTLIVFNTDKINGGIGPSFWFDIASGSFIQLSNRFN